MPPADTPPGDTAPADTPPGDTPPGDTPAGDLLRLFPDTENNGEKVCVELTSGGEDGSSGGQMDGGMKAHR